MFEEIEKIKRFCDFIEGSMSIEYSEVDGWFTFSIKELPCGFVYYWKKCHETTVLLKFLMEEAEKYFNKDYFNELKEYVYAQKNTGET